MIAHLSATLAFSTFAAVAIAAAGRRNAPGSDRLTAAALVILLALPLLMLLPGWSVLAVAQPAAARESPPFLVWLLVAGILPGLARLMLAWLRLRRWILSSRLLGYRLTPAGRRIEIRMLCGLPGPCAAGVLRPVILVPRHWQELPEARRRMILAHEIAHHQRQDPLWRLLGALACVFHWFNPLVWWLARRHAFQAEIACDAAVLRAGARPERYAHLLCDLARSRPAPLVAAMAGSTLGKRVDRLQRPTPQLSRFSLGVVLLLLVAAGLTCGFSRQVVAAPPSEIHLRLSADPFPGNQG